MARTPSRPIPPALCTLPSLGRPCPRCGETMWAACHHSRTITPLDDVGPLTLPIRRCLNRACPPFRRPSRPDAAGRWALPKHECGLDVMAWGGTLRSAHHRRRPAIHPHLCHRGRAVAPRTVPPLLERDDALLTLSRPATTRLPRITPMQGQGILALDGLQPDVGHEGLWGLRDGLSGAVLRARSGLSAPPPALAVRRRTVRHHLQGPLVGLMADGPRSSRGAVAAGGPNGPHPLGHCHALREAAKPM
jgi:hypothetical protein